ncbi:MAG: hypothetical protein IJY74_06310, partial [Oscillospiraceae bacterium]|nr:hypothetical protein [Oscillospiraceae bacterium]
QNHSHLQSVRKCMGISSQSRKKNNETASADNEIKDWCKKILKHKELRDLSADELNQLMGYCSKRAKIKESGL